MTIAFELLSPEDMKNLPPLRWVLDGVLQECSTALLFGPSERGKSFVALEMVGAVSTGCSEVFDVVRTGPVVYVTAEGKYGMRQRIEAWEQARGCEMDNLRTIFIPQAVQLAEPEHIEALVKQTREKLGDEKPELIIFDTLARCSEGLDENASKDMGRVIKHLDVIREVFDCIILVIHHSTKSNSRSERGSGALFGAVDTVFHLDYKRGQLELECFKQKNGAKSPTMLLKLEQVGESCVLNPRKAPKETAKGDASQDVVQLGGGIKKRTFGLLA